MNQIEKVKKVKEQVGEEISKFIKAAKLVAQMDGISMSSDKARLDKIIALIGVYRGNDHKLTAELANGIIKKGRNECKKGMDGSGTFFID